LAQPSRRVVCLAAIPNSNKNTTAAASWSFSSEFSAQQTHNLPHTFDSSALPNSLFMKVLNIF
jgi:hypothetical protein